MMASARTTPPRLLLRHAHRRIAAAPLVAAARTQRPRARRRQRAQSGEGAPEAAAAAAAAAAPGVVFGDDEDAAPFATPTPTPTTTTLPPLQSALDATKEQGSYQLAQAQAGNEEDPILASLFRQADASPPQVARLVRPSSSNGDAGNAGAAGTPDRGSDTAMLARLAAWRAEHGTSHVPRRVHDAADLGEWLWRQRRARRRGGLPAWLARALDGLSVDWRPAPEASLWHADYHAARRARAVAAAAVAGAADDAKEEQQVAGGWQAARAFASAGADGGGGGSRSGSGSGGGGGAFDSRLPRRRRDPQGDPTSPKPVTDPLHASAAAWLRRQGALMLASSPGLAPRDGAAATAAERRDMLRRLGAGLEARAPRSAVADAAAMAGLNAHERKLERRRRRKAERAREERADEARAAVEGAAERAAEGVRAEEARREALRYR